MPREMTHNMALMEELKEETIELDEDLTKKEMAERMAQKYNLDAK